MSSEEEYIDNLILEGAIEVVGISQETGEFLYSFTPKLAEVDPDLHKKFVDAFYSDVVSLWEKGFLKMDITSENPMVSVTEKALNKEEVSSLSEELQMTLIDIVGRMSEI
jgi:hypothetical protein